MSRRHQLMRSPLTLAARIVACCAVVLTAGCGAGQVTQTDSQVGAVDGASDDLGRIAIRDVLIPYPEDHHGVYPPGSDVPVQLTIVNTGLSADSLTSVTSPAAGRVLVQGTTTIPAGMSAASSGEAGQSSGAAGQSTAASGSPPDVGEVRIALTDITRSLRPGQNIEITLVFQNAGTLTLPVPMGPPPESVERQPLEGH